MEELCNDRNGLPDDVDHYTILSELMLLKQALANLADEVGYNFCYGCYNFGKSADYYSGVCDICREWTCDSCSDIHTHSINTSEYTMCGDCYSIINNPKSFMMKILDRTNSEFARWDQFISIFKNPEDVAEHMIDIIEDYLTGGLYYQYQLDLLTLFRGSKDECYLGLEFNLREGYGELDGIVSKEELIEEMMSCIDDGIDGFSFDLGDEMIKDGTLDKEIVLDLLLC